VKRLERYIIHEIVKPFLVVVVILVGLFSCFNVARFLAQAVTETLGVSGMLKLVWLKSLIALEVLIPIALYVSIIIGLGRLHRDQEITAIRSVGISGNRIIKAVFLLALPIAILSGLLSMYGRPWAYKESYLMDAQAQAELNTDRFQAGRFYGAEGSDRVIYIQKKNNSDGLMKNVFHYMNKGDRSEVVLAKRAYRKQMSSEREARLELYDGMMYQLFHKGSGDSVVHFDKMVYYTDISKEVGYNRKAASIMDLVGSSAPRDIAELQWRLSRALATLLLALIAVPLSRSSPRQGKGEKTFTAALIFAIYYNLSGLAQTWVEQGTVPAFPGVWWLEALMLIVVMAMLPGFRRGFTTGR
jgi:lipopolysaccharide export system permease protein